MIPKWSPSPHLSTTKGKEEKKPRGACLHVPHPSPLRYTENQKDGVHVLWATNKLRPPCSFRSLQSSCRDCFSFYPMSWSIYWYRLACLLTSLLSVCVVIIQLIGMFPLGSVVCRPVFIFPTTMNPPFFFNYLSPFPCQPHSYPRSTHNRERKSCIQIKQGLSGS